MPSHEHKQGSEALYNFFGGSEYIGPRGWAEGGGPAYIRQLTSSTGGNKAHPNMPPYYALAYIEYVG